jgi:hypothetical protein
MASESEFYEKIGRVTELAQYLEFDLGHIILMTKAIEKKFYEAPEKNAEAYIKLRDGIDKGTLGQTLSRVKDILSISEDIEEVISEALKARNRFTHHIFREYGLEIHSTSGRSEMLKDVENLRLTMQKAYDFSSSISDQLVEKHLHLVKKYS